MSDARNALLVDDEPSILLTARIALEEQGWAVEAVATGEAAIEAFRQRGFAVVLLDLRLPDIDGLTVLRRLLELQPGVRVVIITAYGTVELAVEAMKLGATDIVRKPFTAAELLAAVDGALKLADADVIAREYDDRVASARALIGEHRYPAAMAQARRAISAEALRPEAYHLIGACLDILGRHLEAQRLYRIALEVDPTFGPSRRNLDRLVFRHGLSGQVELG